MADPETAAKVEQLQEIFPLFSKAQILDVLESQQFMLAPAINALLTMEPEPSPIPVQAQPVLSTLLSLPEVVLPTSSSIPQPAASAGMNHTRPVSPLIPPALTVKSVPPPFPLTKIGLGKLGFNLHQHDVAKDAAAELKDLFEKVAVVASTAALSFSWGADDVAEKAPTMVRYARQAGLTTLVSLSISTESKNGLQELQIPKSLLNGLQGKPSFSHKSVADSYVDTVCLIAQSKPNYLIIATDVNVFAISRTDEFQRFVTAYKVAYREAKKISPQTKVAVSFQYEVFKQIRSENLKVLQDLKPELDAFVVSSHPRDLFDNIGLLPADHYKDLAKFTLEALPVIVLEIGWPSSRPETDAEQAEFVKKLPEYFEGVSPAVLCWDLLRDPGDAGLKLASSGLLTREGNQKLAFTEWEYLQKHSPATEVAKTHKKGLSEGVPLPPPIASDHPGSSVSPLSKLPAVAELHINYDSDAPKIPQHETKAYLVDKTIKEILTSPKVSEISATGWFDLVVARVAHLLAETIYHAATQEAVFENDPNVFNQNTVDSLFQRNLDSHIMRVLKTPNWLEAKERRYSDSPTLAVEVSEDQGPRPHMEDREVVLPFLNEMVGLEDSEPRISFFGVFDGHGGRDTADYVATHLPFVFMQHYRQSASKDIKKILHDAFLQTDADYGKFAARKNLTDVMGSTGVVVVMVGSQMYIAWVGDSEACLVNNKGDVFKFVDCHKPKFESERLRIEKLGGQVTELNGMYRVNGMLAVSRAFGDLRLKSVVLAEPEVSMYSLKGTENFLLLACDGLWDVVSAFDVEEFADNYVNRTGSYKGITTELNTEARRRGSTDNITIIFVKFV